MIAGLLSLIGSGVIVFVLVVCFVLMIQHKDDPSAERVATSIRMMAIVFMACALKYALTF